MPSCPGCANFVPDGSRFCPTCGAPVPPDTNATSAWRRESPAPDETVLPSAAPRSHTMTTPASRAATDASGHYTAGTLLAGRYRIVGLLGKGGMGEVYRADDLTLGQPVALKFIPRDLANDETRLNTFLDEARAARQVAHANVCRVYDIGETADPSGIGPVRRFLTMEYVDGEDLATSLRRIGRFPEDKGLEIARQLCAGLAAVHERGLLHRDLKPANVMLDGRGRVRLTDFGLAGEAHPGAAGSSEVAGTPAYMAPELLRGRRRRCAVTSTRSDSCSTRCYGQAGLRGRNGRGTAPTAGADATRTPLQQRRTDRCRHRRGDLQVPGSESVAAAVVGDRGGGGAARRRPAGGGARGGRDAFARHGGGRRGEPRPHGQGRRRLGRCLLRPVRRGDRIHRRRRLHAPRALRLPARRPRQQGRGPAAHLRLRAATRRPGARLLLAHGLHAVPSTANARTQTAGSR